MNLLHEYIRVLLEQEQGSKGSLIVVDIQPEYESGTLFDVGDMLRAAAEDYSRVLFLFNGEDTLGMVSESALKNFYFEKLDYDEEVFDELLSKSEFFDKGYGFFRDVMDSDACFDRNQVVKIVKYMIDKDIQDIRDLEEEDIEVIGVSELLFDDLEDYGFWVPELSDELPNWNGSDLVGGARNECMAEVEILGVAQGLSFNHVDKFIYEGDNRYIETLTEAATFKHKGSTVYGHKIEDLLRNLKRGEGIYEDEGLEMIEFQKDYLEGMSKKPSVELYRVVFAKSIDDVDRSNLGHHYTDDYDSFTLQMMESLLSQARQENPSLELEDARIVKVSAPANAIDYEEVMRTWSLFPYEYEITLGDTSGVEILDIDDAYESSER